MHPIQQKLLKLSQRRNLAGLTLRKIGELIKEPGSPQKVKHHLSALRKKGLLVLSADGKKITKLIRGINPATNLIALPIYGKANCGEALELADNYIKDYLKISKKIIGTNLAKKIKDVFVLEAVGQSMNRANINGKNIEDGDYVLALKSNQMPQSEEYVVSIIDGAANIKKLYLDQANKQIILTSESIKSIPPIYVHEDDLQDYIYCATVIDVLKKPDELLAFRDASAQDILKDLGPMSKEEYDYYENL